MKAHSDIPENLAILLGAIYCIAVIIFEIVAY
jgi:hypothetical protein